jgi:hypothetical protein
MSSIADQIIRQVLQRQPTAEDYRRMDAILSLYPPEVRSSPGAMVDVAVRIEFHRQLEETIKQAGWSAQQRIHEDLPKRVEQAAIQALNKMRDLMPFDAADSARRMYKCAAIAMAITFMITFIPAYVLGQQAAQRGFEANEAAAHSERNRCVDAAIGGMAVAELSRANSGSAALQVIRNELLACIAKTVERHTGDG